MSILAQIYLGSVLAGCARETPESAPAVADTAEVIVDPAQLTLRAGGEAWLSAQANDPAGQPIGGAALRFRAAAPEVLKVSPQGRVTSLGPAVGQTDVIVTSGRSERLVPVTVLPGPPQRLEKLSGDGQALVAGETPAAPVVVRLLDGHGNPLGGVPVTLRSAAELYPPDEAVTTADGIARFELPRLTRAGTFVAEVQAGPDGGPFESFRLDVRPGPPVDVALAPAPPQADAPATFKLQVIDAYGNPVPDVEVRTRFGTAEAPPVQSKTDSTGSVLVLVEPAAGGSTTQLMVEFPALPDFRRVLDVDLPAPPGPLPAS